MLLIHAIPSLLWLTVPTLYVQLMSHPQKPARLKVPLLYSRRTLALTLADTSDQFVHLSTALTWYKLRSLF